MAKHHPDLIFCRKQPGVGEFSKKPVENPRQSNNSKSLAISCGSHWTPV